MLAYIRVVLGVAGVCLIAGSALAQFPPITDPNKDEAKCQKGTATAITKFTGAKLKCIQKCVATGRKTAGPYGGCFAPGFTNPATNTCIFDPVKGAEAKARASIVKSCANDCPECYAMQGPVCSTGEPTVGDMESQVDPFGNLIFCTEVLGGTPTTAEAKCEDTVAKTFSKFWGAKNKCYQKCQDSMLKGKIAPGSCNPPLPSDPATASCIFDPVKGAEAKAAAAIDKACQPPGIKPACYSTITGSGWVALIESNFDFREGFTHCGSPSGAFLD